MDSEELASNVLLNAARLCISQLGEEQTRDIILGFFSSIEVVTLRGTLCRGGKGGGATLQTLQGPVYVPQYILSKHGADFGGVYDCKATKDRERSSLKAFEIMNVEPSSAVDTAGGEWGVVKSRGPRRANRK